MGTSILARAFTLALLAAATLIAPATGPQPMSASAQMMEDVALTSDMVENFIKSYPQVKADAEAIGKKYNIEGGSGTDSWGAWVTATGAWGELNGAVTPYGFTDFQQWLQVTMTVAKAYAFAESGGGVDAAMSQAIDEIKNNPDIPEAQKEMLLNQMQGSMTAVAGMRPSQENVDAVAPYAAELKALFDN
jgi:hypothetical protein